MRVDSNNINYYTDTLKMLLNVELYYKVNFVLHTNFCEPDGKQIEFHEQIFESKYYQRICVFYVSMGMAFVNIMELLFEKHCQIFIIVTL